MQSGWVGWAYHWQRRRPVPIVVGVPLFCMHDGVPKEVSAALRRATYAVVLLTPTKCVLAAAVALY